jgi:hypothetical protein
MVEPEFVMNYDNINLHPPLGADEVSGLLRQLLTDMVWHLYVVWWFCSYGCYDLQGHRKAVEGGTNTTCSAGGMS